MCFGLRGSREVKDGQIAHLGRDRSSVNIDDLAYLCLECHKVYDSKSNRVQSYTAGEIRHYRGQLYRALGHDQMEWTLTVRADRSQYVLVKQRVQEAHSILSDCTSDVSLHESPAE
jgi:hypothetical protein